MVIETHNPEYNVRCSANLIYTVSETIWRQLDEQESKSQGPGPLS
jgi:hypothetical protein